MSMQGSGQAIQIEPREIEIYSITLDKFDKVNNEIEFVVECSKGTYIRTLCESIAENLGTIGCMKELDRIKVGNFEKKDSIKIAALKENKDNLDFINNHIISFEDLLSDKDCIRLNEKEIEKFLNGVKIEKDLQDEVYRILNKDNEFIGTGVVENRVLKRDIIL